MTVVNVSPTTKLAPPKSTEITPSGFTGAVTTVPPGNVISAVKVVPAGIGVFNVTAPVAVVSPTRTGLIVGVATT